MFSNGFPSTPAHKNIAKGTYTNRNKLLNFQAGWSLVAFYCSSTSRLDHSQQCSGLLMAPCWGVTAGSAPEVTCGSGDSTGASHIQDKSPNVWTHSPFHFTDGGKSFSRLVVPNLYSNYVFLRKQSFSEKTFFRKDKGKYNNLLCFYFYFTISQHFPIINRTVMKI